MDNTQHAQKRFPTWAKVAIGIGVFWLVGFTVLAVAAGQWIAKSLPNAENAAIVADKIIQFRKPLPEEWKLSTGLDMGPMKLAVLINSKDSTVVTMTRYAKGSTTTSILQGATKGAQMTVEQSGEETVAGHKMEFVRGRSNGRRTTAMQVGCIKADNNDIVMIHAIEPSTTSFDPKRIQSVITAIKSVH